MNPLTITKNISKYSERELEKGGKTSWHDQYKDSAWIFIGGLSYDLSEGDVIAIFSQYGEIVNINLVRDKFTGKSKGFCFLCYEDQRSTILAVDNFNGIKVLKRTIRVDHVSDYKMPKESEKIPLDEETRRLHLEGCAPKSQKDIKKEKMSGDDKNISEVIPTIKKEEKSPIRDIDADVNNKTNKSHKRKTNDNDERKGSTKKHKTNKEIRKKRESSSDSSSSPIKSRTKEKRSHKKKYKKEKKIKKKKREKSTSSSSAESRDRSIVISKKESKHKHRKH